MANWCYALRSRPRARSASWPGSTTSSPSLPHAAISALARSIAALNGWKWTRSRLIPCKSFFSQLQHLVNDAILDRLFRAHVVVALCIVFDTLHRLPGMLMDDLVQHVACVQDFARMNINIGSLPGQPTLNKGLVNVNASVWQGAPQAMIAGHQQDRAKASGITHAGCDNRAGQMTH